MYPSMTYRDAFARYLRKGTALSLKADARTTTHYIWRTRDDDHVRTSHAANNGKLFAWSAPPATGHPGEGYNCRCVAEPYVRGETELAHQNITSLAGDASRKWTNTDLTRHFYAGGGRGLTLSEIGHLQGVINYYFYGLGKYNAVNTQIIEIARRHADGRLSYNFHNAYNFGNYLHVFGGGVVAGAFIGSIHRHNGMLTIKGSIEYFYKDMFTDPLSIRELYNDDSAPENMWQIERWTEFGGKYFSIQDDWKTNFYAEVKQDKMGSIY